MQNLKTDNNNVSTNNLPMQDENEIDLGELLGILLDGKWLIILVTLVVFSLGVAKAFLERPIYKTDVMLQVSERPQTMTDLMPLTDFMNVNVSVMAEIELIKSRMILGEAIQNMDLNIIAKPKYFPIVGEAIARNFQLRNQDNAVSSSMFWRAQNAWGGEMIQVETFSVPANWKDKEFILLAGEQGRYQLFGDDEVILTGEVGKFVSKQLNGNQQSVSIFVSLLKSRPGTQFVVMQLSENEALRRLIGNLRVSEKGKSTGILELTLESFDPEYAVQVLNEIANIYVRLNVEHKSAEAQKTLEFLDKQLPILKSQMEAATNILNDYRNDKGSVDLDIETQNILNGIVNIKTQITLLQQNRDELRQRFTESHPNIIAVDKQISRLKKQQKSHDGMINSLPETQQIILGLSRDVQVTSTLYTTLLNNAQTLRVTNAGTVGDVRVIDYALLPNEAIKPRKKLIAGVALIMGLFLGVVAVFVRKLLYRGIEDPSFIEKLLNIPVYATVPYSKIQKLLDKEFSKKASLDNESFVLAMRYSKDIAIESLRSFRTTLYFSLLEAKNNIILITGPSPGIGKTFISVNLALVMADAGKKILLIDADMRRGAINKLLCVNREHGLSEIISGAIPTQDAIREIPQTNIDFIPTGAIPPNPSELLLHKRFNAFLESITKQYDLIIIDSPPILAATDAAIIGRLVGATFMVVKSGVHSKQELEQSVRRFSQPGANIKGVVFNGMPEFSSRSGYGYNYGKYVYQYSYKNSN